MDAWLRAHVAAELNELELEDDKTGPDPEKALNPVIERLPPRLRHRFREALARSLFYEVAGDFCDSLTCELRFVSIDDAPRAQAGFCRLASGTTRLYSIVLESLIEANDFTAEQIERRYAGARRRWVEEFPHHASLGDRPVPSAEQIEDQRILLRGLLESSETLDAWLRDLIMVGLDVSEAVKGAESLAHRDRLLIPVVESLPPRQRHRFREAIAQDRLIEIAEEFWDSFHCQRRLIEITECV